MSLQYGVSAALLLGRIDEVAYLQFKDAQLKTLIERSVVETDAAYDSALSQGRQPCRIEICMKDGTEYQEALQDVPWLDATTVEARFKDEASRVFDAHAVDQIVQECGALDTNDRSCACLFTLLATSKAANDDLSST